MHRNHQGEARGPKSSNRRAARGQESPSGCRWIPMSPGPCLSSPIPTSGVTVASLRAYRERRGSIRSFFQCLPVFSPRRQADFGSLAPDGGTVNHICTRQENLSVSSESSAPSAITVLRTAPAPTTFLRRAKRRRSSFHPADRTPWVMVCLERSGRQYHGPIGWEPHLTPFRT